MPPGRGAGWIPPRVPGTFGCCWEGSGNEERQGRGEEEEGDGICPKSSAWNCAGRAERCLGAAPALAARFHKNPMIYKPISQWLREGRAGSRPESPGMAQPWIERGSSQPIIPPSPACPGGHRLSFPSPERELGNGRCWQDPAPASGCFSR